MDKHRFSNFIPFISILTFFLVWFCASFFGVITETSPIPNFFSVIKAAQSLISQGLLERDLVATILRVIPGIIFGSIIGLIVGLATGRVPKLYQSIGPILQMWRAMPAVALVPFLLVVFGVSESAKIAIVAFGVFFPVWINTHEGAWLVDLKYLEVAKDLDFTKLQEYKRVVFPSTVPFTVAGIRTGIAIAYIMVFIGEWVGANKGIGYQLSVAHTVSSMEHMVVGLILLGLLSYLTDAAFRIGVRLIFPWLDAKNG